MKLTRDEFLKLCGVSAAAGVGISPQGCEPLLQALSQALSGRPPVIWLQGASCTGCCVSVLNTVDPSIGEVLLESIDMHYQPNLMAQAGENAIDEMEEVSVRARRRFLLVVEGAVPTKDGGVYCSIGERDGEDITMWEAVEELGAKAHAIIALGTCAAHGGVPKGEPDPTGAKDVREILEEAGIETPLINLPGCPPHPDWFIFTLLHVLEGDMPDLDEKLRPGELFSERIHSKMCPFLPHYRLNWFATKFGETGCLEELGCKGAMADADCPIRRWNNGVEWCIGVGAPCIGCTDEGFPDDVSPLYAHRDLVRAAERAVEEPSAPRTPRRVYDPVPGESTPQIRERRQ